MNACANEARNYSVKVAKSSTFGDKTASFGKLGSTSVTLTTHGKDSEGTHFAKFRQPFGANHPLPPPCTLSHQAKVFLRIDQIKENYAVFRERVLGCAAKKVEQEKTVGAAPMDIG